jgi:Holliday junction resolvase RusA-like endonuclease
MSIIFKGRMPLPPGINQSYKIVRVLNKKHELVQTIGPTPELEQFKLSASWMLLDAQNFQDRAAIQRVKALKAKTPLAVLLWFYFPTPWLRDVDGGIKAAMDATFKHIGLNDNMVVRVAAEKRVDRKDPRCEIEVSILEQEVA